ncbi:hypothetical protein [Mobiluncus mulieris]|nr:hypothetical protein [Mobiluncus mulieris]
MRCWPGWRAWRAAVLFRVHEATVGVVGVAIVVAVGGPVAGC